MQSEENTGDESIKRENALRENPPRRQNFKPRSPVELTTKIDGLVKLLSTQKKVRFGDAAKRLDWGERYVEAVSRLLERMDAVSVHYSPTMVAAPTVSLKKKLAYSLPSLAEGELLDQYSFTVDGVPADVNVVKARDDNRPFYELSLPLLKPYTRLFLEGVRGDIAEEIPLEATEVGDPTKAAEVKQRFHVAGRTRLTELLGEGEAKHVDILSGYLLHALYGLGKLELLMCDNNLEEIAINSSQTPVTVYHRGYGWMKSNLRLDSEDKIANISSQIGRRVGRDITNLEPILDAHLTAGDRVNATLRPISSFGNTVTIRRFARRPWTVIDFIGKGHTMNAEMAALLWMALHFELNVLVAGGTASGKTSALNTLCAMIPPFHRVISIEDVREIMLPETLRWNWVPLTTRNPNPEGLGEVSMLDLMVNSLRMRPDRIIVGEIRRQREAEVLFEAMHTGHSVYSTIHANSARQVLRRLLEPPISVPPLEVEAIDLMLVQIRDRRTNVRRTYEIAEVESGVTGEQLTLNSIYRWRPRDDSWEKVNEPTKFVRQLNLHTGLTGEEVKADLAERESILTWMRDHGYGDIDQVGNVMKLYYSDKKKLVDAVNQKVKPSQLFGG